MSKHRRSQRHGKCKAPPGAFSDRYGPRLARLSREWGRPNADTDPWVKDWPADGSPSLISPDHGIVVRRS